MPAAGLGIGHDVPQAERALAELGRRGVRGGGTSLAHRLHRRGERPRRVVGAEPVVGDLGGEAPGARGSRRLVGLGVTGVEPGAFAREQVVEDRLAHERVPERVVVAVDREHAEVTHWRAAASSSSAVPRYTCGEQRVRDADAAGGDEPQELLRRLGQALVAGEQQFAERVGHEALVAASVDADQLLDEERHAVAAAEHRVEHPSRSEPRRRSSTCASLRTWLRVSRPSSRRSTQRSRSASERKSRTGCPRVTSSVR